MPCPICGSTMYGDGYTMVRHCEHADIYSDDVGYEPDADAVFCHPLGAHTMSNDQLTLSEAMTALRDGKTVRCTLTADNGAATYTDFVLLCGKLYQGKIAMGPTRHFSAAMILDGVWSLVEEDADAAAGEAALYSRDKLSMPK